MKTQTRHSPLPWNGIILGLALFAWAGVFFGLSSRFYISWFPK